MKKIETENQYLVIGTIAEWQEVLRSQPSDEPFSLMEQAERLIPSLEEADPASINLDLIRQLNRQGPTKEPPQETGDNLSVDQR